MLRMFFFSFFAKMTLGINFFYNYSARSDKRADGSVCYSFTLRCCAAYFVLVLIQLGNLMHVRYLYIDEDVRKDG